MVDEKGNVVINSPETDRRARVREAALRDLRPGHALVARPEQQQGVPRRPDQPHHQRHLGLLRGEELAGREGEGDGGRHRPRQLPDRPGRARPTELHLFFPQMIFKYTKFPNAAKAYLAFMMEKEQYEPWQAGRRSAT